MSDSDAHSSFINNLEWRRAVKHFGKKSVDSAPIIRAITNAPSSFGLQPYRIIVVRNENLKTALREVSYDQPQITECDTLFIFCARTDITERAEEYLKITGAEDIRGMMMGFISYLPDRISWAARQAYIALGFGLAACAELQIPSCPMEGFSISEVHRILRLDDKLVPVAMLAVGSAAENDGSSATMPRFRFDHSDLIDERN